MLADTLIGVVSMLAGMIIALLFYSIWWYCMGGRAADRGASRSFYWMSLLWGALWLSQGLRDQIARPWFW
jgi:hypothetical protein